MVTMIMDSQVDYYSRSFQKGQNVLANVGGVIKGLMVMAQILTFFITNEMYYLELVSSLFRINSNSTPTPKRQIASRVNTLKHRTVASKNSEDFPRIGGNEINMEPPNQRGTIEKVKTLSRSNLSVFSGVARQK